MHIFSTTFIGFLATALVTDGHMLMRFPPPRGYKENTSYGDIDYNLNAPLPSNVMCKGKPPGPVAYTANGTQILDSLTVSSSPYAII